MLDQEPRMPEGWTIDEPGGDAGAQSAVVAKLYRRLPPMWIRDVLKGLLFPFLLGGAAFAGVKLKLALDWPFTSEIHLYVVVGAMVFLVLAMEGLAIAKLVRNRTDCTLILSATEIRLRSSGSSDRERCFDPGTVRLVSIKRTGRGPFLELDLHHGKSARLVEPAEMEHEDLVFVHHLVYQLLERLESRGAAS